MKSQKPPDGWQKKRTMRDFKEESCNNIETTLYNLRKASLRITQKGISFLKHGENVHNSCSCHVYRYSTAGIEP
jgi:hypothetical protein